MPETPAASSPAETDVFQGQQPTLEEFNSYRESGELPERFKPKADPAPPEPPEEVESESAGESDTPKETQEKPRKHLTAEQRTSQLKAKIEELWQADEPDHIKIAQLEATIDKIETGAKRKTAPAPVAPQQPQQATRPKPAIDAKDKDDKPLYATYEDYIEDLADWKAEQRIAQVENKRAEWMQAQQAQQQVAEIRTRYGDDYENIIDPTAGAIMNDQSIPYQIKQMIGQSDVLPDLVFTLGSDPKAMEKLIKVSRTDPRAAVRYIAALESGIHDAQKPESPVRPKTNAPKPPSPVNGGSSRAFDVSDDSLSADEWMRKRNEQLARKRG